MKKIFVVLLVGVFVISYLNINAFADNTVLPDSSISLLRAGGGSSGGGGGGSSGGSSGSGGSRGSGGTHYSSRGGLLDNILTMVLFPFFLGASTIAFSIRLTRRSRKSKKLMKQIARSDNAWKFKNIEDVVSESFYAIQTAWSNLDMSPAVKYMSDELYESFQTKLSWMKYRKEKNIIKDIKLIEALPVAVYDNANNARDYIWFYVKAKMVDYTIDTETQVKISGSTSPTKFVEYWQFVRKGDDWVLNKILQEDESDQIAFTE